LVKIIEKERNCEFIYCDFYGGLDKLATFKFKKYFPWVGEWEQSLLNTFYLYRPTFAEIPGTIQGLPSVLKPHNWE